MTEMKIFIYIASRCRLFADKYFTRLMGGSCIFIITWPLMINMNIAPRLVERILDCKPILNENYYYYYFTGIIFLISLIIVSFLDKNYSNLIRKYERENSFNQIKKYKLVIDLLLILHFVIWIPMAITIIFLPE